MADSNRVIATRTGGKPAYLGFQGRQLTDVTNKQWREQREAERNSGLFGRFLRNR